MALPSRASKGSPPGAFARPASQSWAYAVRVTNVRRKLQLLASQTSVRSSFGTSCAMHDSLVAMFLKAVIKPMDLAKLVGAVPLLLGPLGGLAPLASAIMPILSKIPLDAASARSGREIALNFEKSVEHRRKLLHRVMEAQVSRAKREERFAIEDDGRERRRSSRSRSRTASKRKPDTGGRAPSADRLRDDFETFSRAYDSALDYALEDSTDLAHAKKAVKHLDNEVQDRESGTRAARAFARLPRQAREEVKAKVMTSSVEAETALDTATLFSGVRQLMYALLAVYVAYKFSSNALELVQTHTPPQILSMFGLESEAQKAEALEQRTRKLREQERERQAQRLQGDIAERRYRDRIRDIQRGPWPGPVGRTRRGAHGSERCACSRARLFRLEALFATANMYAAAAALLSRAQARRLPFACRPEGLSATCRCARLASLLSPGMDGLPPRRHSRRAPRGRWRNVLSCRNLAESSTGSSTWLLLFLSGPHYSSPREGSSQDSRRRDWASRTRGRTRVTACPSVGRWAEN